MADKKNKRSVKLPKWRPTERQKKISIYTLGAVVGIFAVLSLQSFVSYLITWQADFSTLNDPAVMDRSTSIANWGGKAGFPWAHLMVGEWFGLSAFCLIVFLAAVAVKAFGKAGVKLLPLGLQTLTGMYLLSIVLSFIGIHTGLESWLPSGLGGGAGAATVLFLEELFKPLITFLIILLLCSLWLVIARPSFFERLSSIRIPAWMSRRRNGGETEDEVEEGPQDEVPVEFAPGSPAESAGPAEVLTQEVPPADPLQSEDEPEDGEDTVETTEEEVADESGLDISVDRGEGYDTHVTEELTQQIDYKDKVANFQFPSIDLLGDYQSAQHEVPRSEIEATSLKIQSSLRSFKIEVTGVTAIPGPTVTLYKLKLGEGVKISQVKNLQEDIGISLGAQKGVRVVKLNDSVGIEVANANPSVVPLKSMLDDDSFRNSKAELPIAIGYTISREVKTFDLADAPHLLVAGATKQGKSVGLNVIINSLLFSKHPSELKFVFVDPKMVEFSAYGALINHYMAVLPNPASESEMKDNAIITTQDGAESVLKSLVQEMEDRYLLMRQAGVNQVKLYNQKYIDRFLNPEQGHRYMPYIVAIIDEYADLTMSGFGPEAKTKAKHISESIIRLAQKGRAAGLHVIIATQRPSADVVTSLIKTNFPMRIAFRVVSHGDSETILGKPGAEKLIGKGDMLLYAGAEEMLRVQCAYISGEEISRVVSFIGQQTGYKQSSGPFFLPEPPDDGSAAAGDIPKDVGKPDARFEEAARLVVEYGRASTTEIQRKMGLGYAKAARIMDQLEAHGIVGPSLGAKPREVLVQDFQQLQSILDVIL